LVTDAVIDGVEVIDGVILIVGLKLGVMVGVEVNDGVIEGVKLGVGVILVEDGVGVNKTLQFTTSNF
jgi:hypothetical protein